MLEIEVVLTLSREEKIQQIEIRHKLISMMAGYSTPAILRDEITQIQKSMQ